MSALAAPARPTAVATGTRVAAVGLLTGWGEGPDALPADAMRAAAGRDVIALAPPALRSERLRRATRECLLGVAAVEALLRAAALGRDDVRGSETALVYVTTAAYGASNVAFVEATAGGTLHFPYTAPSAVPAEVAIEFGLTGPYLILLGGPAAAIDALWQATRLLEGRGCERVLVLAVETFAECEGLWLRGRRLVRGPLVEAAACALLVPGGFAATYTAPAEPAPLETLARRRAGETLACGPFVALALAGQMRARGPLALSGRWRGRRAGLAWTAA